jgi:hypothetical protein
MAQLRQIRPGYAVIRPNRERAVCKLTRLFVVLVLLVSVGLMLAVTIGGWSKLEGMTPINFVWCAVYLVMAFYIARCARGLLPLAAVLGVLLLAIAAIAGFGLGGTSWYDRSHSAFAGAHALGGGRGLSADLLGTLVFLLIPVELVLVLIAVVGFAQGWNVEQEVTSEEAERRGSRPVAQGPRPTAA